MLTNMVLFYVQCILKYEFRYTFVSTFNGLDIWAHFVHVLKCGMVREAIGEYEFGVNVSYARDW